ncbi:unnamed protein product [Medioppia subpectinata]|uniref:CD80-like immunoglobulin C2-set domain-containing protein n=1 Tax=Medioppia subpectinata TaxID=1979941 RepID=A0A7R9KF64_9ACAR|nr:unnamed protein product [Medioppia subpectinata]CAG2101461.1 unnamed protein product [Medioppia subpectinata]
MFMLPSEGPKISGSRANYGVGSRVELNCTSAKSKPAALLHWYINEQPAENEYEFDSLTTLHSNGLESSSLGLRFIDIIISNIVSKIALKVQLESRQRRAD